MKKRFINSERLDEVGAQLLKSASLKDEEIEKLVSRPGLFAAIVKEIETKRKRREISVSPSSIRERLSANQRKIGLSFGVLGVIFGVLLVLPYVQEQKPSQNLISENNILSEFNDSAVNNQDSEISRKTAIEFINPSNTIAKPEKIKQKTSVTAKNSKSIDRPSKRKTIPRKQKQMSDEEIFYSLTFAADLNDEDNRRIIRVGLSRDSLFAFGLNELIVNEDEIIVTDLIIGLDGTPQAYRFVNNF